MHKKTSSEQSKNHPKQSFIRVNGWSYPLHPLQILGWLFFLMFAIVYFVILVPTLPTTTTRLAALSTNLFVCLLHCITHIAAMNVNPADENVTRKLKSNKFQPTTFDRTKHTHVIENQFCYICECHVGPKSKHCSSCNKCISNFDHHCKWLNNCVGSKNYKLFISTVVSALIGCLIVFTVSIILTIAFFSPKSWLHDQSSNLLFFNNFSTNSSLTHKQNYQNIKLIWISIVIFICILSLIAVSMLAHLLGFHVFLNCIGLSTYEFVVQQRNSSQAESNSSKSKCFTHFLQQHIFVCCIKNRIKPSPESNMPKENFSKHKENHQNDLDKMKESRRSSKSDIKSGDKVKNGYDMNSIKTHNETNERNFQSHHSINTSNSNLDKINESEDEIIKTDLSSDIQTKTNEDLVTSNNHKNQVDLKVQNEDMKEPIFKSLNDKNGRTSRMSFVHNNQIVPITNSSQFSPIRFFVRRKSSLKINQLYPIKLDPINSRFSQQDISINNRI